LIKKISEVEYSQKDKLFLTKHKNLQNLIKKETISIEYCQKQTLYLKEIAKSLGIDLGSVRVCKIINGVKRCGLRRVFKGGRVYYIERVSIFTIIIYRKRNGKIENIKNHGRFTKFTKYGSCWEKKQLEWMIQQEI